MRPKSLILLAMALGCGLIAAVGINQILATPSDAKPTVNIVVAKREVKKGDMIKPDDIRLQEWHVDALPEGAIQKIDDLAERRVKTLVVPGEAILESKLVPKNGGRESEIPPGMKGVAVKVDNVSGGAGLILPGDNVDVLIHVEANQQRGIPMTMTKVLLKNVKVHAVDDVLERPAPGEPSIPAKTVTLLVTPKQATVVTYATEIGNIRLVLRSEKDSQNEEDAISDSVSINDVLGSTMNTPETPSNSGPALPSFDIKPLPDPGIGTAVGEGMRGLTDFLEKMKDARDLGAPEQVEKPWKMVVIEGSASKEMEFAKDSRLGRAATPPPAGPSLLEPEPPALPSLETETQSEK